jgi:hypothetical protein
MGFKGTRSWFDVHFQVPYLLMESGEKGGEAVEQEEGVGSAG